MDLFSATQYLLFLAIVTALVTSLGRYMANGSRRVPDLMSLPHFKAATAPWRIGPDRASCGAAAFTKQRVIAPNISKDPRWPDGLGLIDCLDSN